LLTSLLIWMQSYFILLCRPKNQPLDLRAIWPGILLGLLAAAFLTLYIPLVKGRAHSMQRQRPAK
jgi:drug/metabolite transporter (DMT)-like permease